MPQSHPTFCPVPAMKLLGIMFINRCWPTTFHITIARDVDGCAKSGWCDHPLTPQSHQIFCPVLAMKLLRIMLEIDVGPPLFTLLHPEMMTNATKSGWCDQPLNWLIYNYRSDDLILN